MVSDVESFLEQILSIRQDAPGVVGGLSDDAFNWMPASNAWSIGQCFEHLNLIAAGYLPRVEAAVDAARAAGRTSRGPFSYGFIERWIAKEMEPPPKRRLRAPRSLSAQSALSRDAVMTRFFETQDSLAALIRRADGIDLQRTKLRALIGPLRLSVGQIFQILLAHERRHIWQAREVRKALERAERTGLRAEPA